MAVTRDDVARRAGVSTAVVSYVLNDGPRAVSARTREKVLAAIDELGYRRDGVARALAAGRSGTLGLLVPDITSPYFSRIAQEVTDQASARSFNVLIGTSRWSVEAEHDQLRAFAENRVEGIVLMSVAPEQDFSSLVGIGPRVAIVDRPSYARDGAAVVTRHLADHGRRRISFISGDTSHTASRRRLEGWRAEVEMRGLEGEHLEGGSLEGGGYEAARRLRDADAVVVEQDAQAMGVLRRLAELGVGVPGDVAVASTDSTSIGAFTVPSLTALEQPSNDIAAEAVRAALDGGAPMLQRLAHEGFELVRRESCGC